MKVKDIMTKKPIVAYVPGNQRETLKILVTSDKTGLPVVNKNDQKYVGFITRQDFFRHPDEDQLFLIMNQEYPIVSPDTPTVDAARMLVEKGLHHLPVIDKKRNVVGIVTPADFLQLIEKNKIKTPIHRFIRTAFIPVYERTPLRLAAEITGMCNVYALPVLDEKGKLTGIITDRDIFNLSLINPKIAMSDLGISGDMDSWAWEGVKNVMKLYYEVSKIHLPKVIVKDVMIKKPITAYDKMPVWEAARIMRKNDYGQLPVRNAKDKLLGMVYELDTLLSLIG